MNPKTQMSFIKYILIILIITIFVQGSVAVNEIYGYYSLPNIFAFSRIGFPLMSYRLLGIPFYNYMSSPYFFNQTYGLGNFYGPNGAPGIYGLSNLYCLNPFNFFGFSSSGLAFPGDLITIGLNNPLFAAEQAGAWTGTWNLGFLYGTMIMNLQESITGSLSGTAQLIGNLTFGGIFNVYGSSDPTFISLSGQDPTLTYAVTLQGILTTPGTMEGFYSIYKIGATLPKETGTFNLELLV